MSKFKPIPITAAERIAKTYGYDQVVIIARAAGDGGGEHVTTYGVDADNCLVAAKIGDFLKHKVMGWKPEPNRYTAEELVLAFNKEARPGESLAQALDRAVRTLKATRNTGE